jgi:hypothetical protein
MIARVISMKGHSYEELADQKSTDIGNLLTVHWDYNWNQ